MRRSESLKAWWVRHRPSRRGRIAKNLLLTAVLALALWAAAGYPLPTAEMEFRRLERVNLLPRSEIVFAMPEFYQSALATGRSHRTVTALDGTELTLNRHWLVGVAENQGVAAAVDNGGSKEIWTIPLEAEGPTLLFFGDGTMWDAWGYWMEEGPVQGGYQYTYHNFLPLLALNVPEGTARIELVLADDLGRLKQGSGWDLGEGIWLLGVENDGSAAFAERLAARPYTLRLYREDGTLLLERSWTFPAL